LTGKQLTLYNSNIFPVSECTTVLIQNYMSPDPTRHDGGDRLWCRWHCVPGRMEAWWYDNHSIVSALRSRFGEYNDADNVIMYCVIKTF